MMSGVNTSPDYVRRMRNGFFTCVKECISSLNLLDVVMFLLLRYEGPLQNLVAIIHSIKQDGVVCGKSELQKGVPNVVYSSLSST